LQCPAVCCRVLQGVAVSCSVLQCVAECCRMLQCPAFCCSVLRCAAVCCSVLQCVAECCRVLQCPAVCCSVLQCVAVSCSVLYVYDSWGNPCIPTVRRNSVCCSALQCVATRYVCMTHGEIHFTHQSGALHTQHTKHTWAHMTHLCTGFMGAPAGHEKASAKSEFCDTTPLVRNGLGEWESPVAVGVAAIGLVIVVSCTWC